MNNLPVTKPTFTKINTLEEGLDFLCHYGEPKLSKMDNGWHCWTKMFVASEGSSFEIRSDFDHKTYIEAVNTCCERVVKALESLVK